MTDQLLLCRPRRSFAFATPVPPYQHIVQVGKLAAPLILPPPNGGGKDDRAGTNPMLRRYRGHSEWYLALSSKFKSQNVPTSTNWHLFRLEFMPVL